MPRSGSDEERFAALEVEIQALREELAELRGSVRRAEPRASTQPSAPARRPSLSGEQVESWVGRYGTLLAGAFVILLGVGTLLVWAVQRGLLSPQVRVAAGVVATACVAAAGVRFRRRGERRYGNVLLALSLAMTAVVAWGAGPRLHIVSAGVALAVVDLVALAIAALATHDDSEFLFAVAVAGALSAPFITSDNTGRPDILLAYGAVVLLGGIRASSDPDWRRAPILLVVGAVLYELAAAALPGVRAWYGPYLVPLFGGVLALGALVLAGPVWRGGLARAFLGAALLGVLFGWDSIPGQPVAVTALVAAGLLVTTYAALWVDHPPPLLWGASAFVLPLLSLGVAQARAEGRAAESALFAGWGLVALAMWRAERWRGRPGRGSVHLLLATILVAMGTARWFWPNPLALVAGLGGVGVLAAFLARHEERALPALGFVVPLGGAALSAIDQLASLRPYAYAPFATRASASAFVALLSAAGAALLLTGGRGAPSRVIGRSHSMAALAGLAFVWGRMEMVHAFSRDASTFLLTLYYAATGVAGIIVGRRTDNKAFRVAGLMVAIYAAAKAVIEATNISGLMLRVGCYAAVGVFLLGAAYLYRNAGTEESAVGGSEPASGATSG